MWVWYSLFFALLFSIGISITKKLTSRMNLFLLILAQGVFLSPFMLLIIFLSGGIPHPFSSFYALVFMAAILDFLAAIFSMYAIKVSPISLILPISSFNPVFTAIIASLALHEILSLAKILGILIIVLGAYLLNVSELKDGMLTPFKKLFANRGVLFFLLANLLWAITPIFQKQAIFQTKPVVPLFTSFFEGLIVTAFFIPFVLAKTKNQFTQVGKNWKLLLLLGSFGAVAQWAAFTAFSLASLGSVTAIFKLSILFTIVFGGVFLKEERIKERLLGGGVMVLGAILLAL